MHVNQTLGHGCFKSNTPPRLYLRTLIVQVEFGNNGKWCKERLMHSQEHDTLLTNQGGSFLQTLWHGTNLAGLQITPY